MFGNRQIQEAGGAAFQDPNFRTVLVNFIHNGTVYDLTGGRVAFNGDVAALNYLQRRSPLHAAHNRWRAAQPRRIDPPVRGLWAMLTRMSGCAHWPERPMNISLPTAGGLRRLKALVVLAACGWAALLAPAAHAAGDADEAFLLQVLSDLGVRDWPQQVRLPAAWIQAFEADLAATRTDLRERGRCLSLRGAEPNEAQARMAAMVALAERRQRQGDRDFSDAHGLRQRFMQGDSNEAGVAGKVGETGAIANPAMGTASALLAPRWSVGNTMSGGVMSIHIERQVDTCIGAFVGDFHTHPVDLGADTPATPSEGDSFGLLARTRPFMRVVGDLAGGLCAAFKPRAAVAEPPEWLSPLGRGYAAASFDRQLALMAGAFDARHWVSPTAALALPKFDDTRLRATVFRRLHLLLAPILAERGARLYCGARGEPLRPVPLDAALPEQHANPGHVMAAKALALAMAFIDRPSAPDLPFLLSGDLDPGYREHLRTEARRLHQGRPLALAPAMLAALDTPAGPPARLVLAFEYLRMAVRGDLTGPPALSGVDFDMLDARDTLNFQAQAGAPIKLVIQAVRGPKDEAIFTVGQHLALDIRDASNIQLRRRLLARLTERGGQVRLGLDSSSSRVDGDGRSRTVSQPVDTLAHDMRP